MSENNDEKKLVLTNKKKIIENGKSDLNFYYPFCLLEEKLYYINNENKLSFINLKTKEETNHENINIENFKSIKSSNDNNYLMISKEKEIILYEYNLINHNLNVKKQPEIIPTKNNIKDFLNYQYKKTGIFESEYNEKIMIYVSNKFIERNFNGNFEPKSNLINENDLKFVNKLNNVINLNINDDGNLLLINDCNRIFVKNLNKKKFVEIKTEKNSNFANVINFNNKNYVYSCENDGVIRCYNLEGKINNFCNSNLQNGLFNFIPFFNKKKYLIINGKTKILIYDLEKNEFNNEFEFFNEILSILNYNNKLLIYDKKGEIYSFDIIITEKEKNKIKCSFCNLEFESNFEKHLFEAHKNEIIEKYNKKKVINIQEKKNEEEKETNSSYSASESSSYSNHIPLNSKMRIKKSELKNLSSEIDSSSYSNHIPLNSKMRIENNSSLKNESSNHINGKIRIKSIKKNKIEDQESSSSNIKNTQIIINKKKPKCSFCNLEFENIDKHIFEEHKKEIIEKYNAGIN